MSEQPVSSTEIEEEGPSIVTFNMEDPEDAGNALKILKDLITFHTDQKYRHLNKEFFDKIAGQSLGSQVHACQIELSNTVISYYLTQAMKVRLEAEKMQKEVAAEVPGANHAI